MSDLIKCRLDIILIRCRAECLKSDITFEIPGELKKNAHTPPWSNYNWDWTFRICLLLKAFQLI